MRIKHTRKQRQRQTQVALICALIVGVMLVFANRVTQTRAVDDASTPTYTFYQKVRVSDNQTWNEAIFNPDGSSYYYPAGAPAIVEFALTFIQNEEKYDEVDILIKNSLPAEMEYIEGTQKISGSGFSIDENQPPTAANRIFQIKHISPPSPGFPDFPPVIEAGSKIVVTFQARFLFDIGSCQTVTSYASIDVVDSVSGTIPAVFESPCSGLPAPTPDLTPTPVPTPTPSPDKIEPNTISQ